MEGLPSFDLTRLCQFKVKSVIIRTGETMTKGHYIIWTRSFSVTGWHKISDTHIANHKDFKNSSFTLQLFF